MSLRRPDNTYNLSPSILDQFELLKRSDQLQIKGPFFPTKWAFFSGGLIFPGPYSINRCEPAVIWLGTSCSQPEKLNVAVCELEYCTMAT